MTVFRQSKHSHVSLGRDGLVVVESRFEIQLLVVSLGIRALSFVVVRQRKRCCWMGLAGKMPLARRAARSWSRGHVHSCFCLLFEHAHLDNMDRHPSRCMYGRDHCCAHSALVVRVGGYVACLWPRVAPACSGPPSLAGCELSLRLDGHQRWDRGREDMRSRRGAEHVIAEMEASLRRGKTLVTYDLRSQGLGTESWAWPLLRAREPRAGHRLGADCRHWLQPITAVLAGSGFVLCQKLLRPTRRHMRQQSVLAQLALRPCNSLSSWLLLTCLRNAERASAACLAVLTCVTFCCS